MDLPNQPSDLFEEEVDKALFGTYMPMYISTVTFGRMALFTIESELKEQEVMTYLNASYGSVNAQASSDFESLKAKSTMKVYVLGGSGSSAGAIIDGFEAFKDYIKDGGNYSKESPGAPIAYKLRYIRDNSIGKIVFAASYPIRTAIPREDNIVYDIQTYLRSFEAHASDAGGNLELYGGVFSYPKHLGFDAYHRHWSGFTYMSSSVTRDFAEDTFAVTNWIGLRQTDTISININIKEEDDGPNDQYTIKTFEVPVAEIALGEVNTDDYYVKTNLNVYDGTDWIKVTFWFKPVMRRLDD